MDHTTKRHPEMSSEREKVLETPRELDMIQQGDFGELIAVRHYPVTPLTSKFMIVAYREVSLDDGFVLTAYLTNRPSARRVTLWKR